MAWDGDDGGVRAALDELAQARQGPYYDEQADGEARRAYYEGIDPESGPEAFFVALSLLVTSTHTNRPRYKPHLHLYPAVDLQPDGRLRSVYTGDIYDPEQLITEDAETDRRRQELLAQRLVGPEALSERALLELEAELDAAVPFNCEHVVPQSWFGRREPMRGDLHHLFTCEKDCNSFRGNTPYFDFADFGEAQLQEVIRQRCGKREENRFEPGGGKGEVARATLYFILRYPGEINRSATELEEDRLAVILDWHATFPVSTYERRRNHLIQAKQGNRNPFIDEPEWAGLATLAAGLG